VDAKLKAFIIAGLRRLTYKFPARSAAKMRARVYASAHPEIEVSGHTKYLYRCACCGQLFKEKEIAVDHIIPVIDPSSTVWDWNEYIKRLFCDVEGLQILCRDKCHAAKTKAENGKRKSTRDINRSVKPSKRKPAASKKAKSRIRRSKR
jgi:5-methylcytosine-specific restriction endonuclease McrA